MEVTERQVHMGTQTDGPVKRAHAPRCSHPHRLWGGSAVTCVCYPMKGGSLCRLHQIVASLCFGRRRETTWTLWVSLTLHLLSKQTNVSKVAPLIAAIPAHQLESDKVAISSRQSGAIICRCWHFSLTKNEFAFIVALVVGCLLPLVVVRLASAYLLPDRPSPGTLHVSWQKHSSLFPTAAGLGCIPIRNCGSWMLSGPVAGSLSCRRRIHSQPTHEWMKDQPLGEIIGKKTIFPPFRGFRSSFGCGRI